MTLHSEIEKILEGTDLMLKGMYYDDVDKILALISTKLKEAMPEEKHIDYDPYPNNYSKCNGWNDCRAKFVSIIDELTKPV